MPIDFAPPTKLRPPPRRRGLIRRPHVLARLDRACDTALTVVSAPAGYGKTTAVAAWIDQADQRCKGVRARWITLEAADADPARLCGLLVTALHGLDGVGARAARLTEMPAPPQALVAALLVDLADAPPVVLVLDDYETVRHSPAEDVVDALLSHPSPALHLVILTRTDPPGPIVPLRAAGRLCEVGPDDLTFTVPESLAFLRETMGLSVEEAQAGRSRP